jgi:hypothetical protein
MSSDYGILLKQVLAMFTLKYKYKATTLSSSTWTTELDFVYVSHLARTKTHQSINGSQKLCAVRASNASGELREAK